MRWLLFFDNVQHRVGDPKYRRRTAVVGRESRAANQGKMCAINQRHRVEQIQFFFFFSHLASRTDLSTIDEGANRLETLDLTGKNFSGSKILVNQASWLGRVSRLDYSPVLPKVVCPDTTKAKTWQRQ